MNNNDFFIYGIHPVSEALTADEMRISKVYIKEGLQSKGIREIEQLASSAKVLVNRVPGRKLAEMVGKVNDQGVVAELAPVTYHELDVWLENLNIDENPFVIVLDEIEDVHNFGAILRSAAAAGASGVIVPKHRQAPVNATVFKTSAGTAGMVPIIRVTNINQSLELLKEYRFWTAALDLKGDKTIWDEDYNAPMAIIIGSEGRGVRQKVRENADLVLSIPIDERVESLNASVSAALVMFEIRRKRDK